MNFKEFTAHCRTLIQKHPDLREEIMDFHSLAQSEIEEGGSESHEISLALNDIEELIKESTQ